MEYGNTRDWLSDLVPEKGLSPAMMRVIQVLMTNQRVASYGDVGEIATRAQVNSSTVVRCAQALGFKGWPVLQQELRARYLASLSSEETFYAHGETASSPGHNAIRQDIQNLRETLESVDPTDVDRAIETIAGSRRVVVVATGTFAAVGQIFAHLGSVLGYPISLETRGAVHLSSALAGFGPEDTLIVINVWRPIRDLLNAARLARKAGARVLTITDSRRGPYTELSDLMLVVPSEGVSFFQSVTAATSLAYGIVDGLAQVDPARTQERLRAARDYWETLQTYES
ncbi:MurR/RpiR family transcriptional regulator [Nonomuraea indica]|uniref:MurR/RpiR family transcriptional regulator n=1 Tax=Nonomuraea indica TaxID=1581193 RepID=A0ABW8ADU3_9ACTN|nr:MurR/RpiR family transcriptional regulator [Nonomuraea indica]